MVYADFNEYTELGGNAFSGADEFIRCARIASRALDSLTEGRVERLDVIPDIVVEAVCAGAEAVLHHESRDGIASESAGSWSRSYSTASAANGTAAAKTVMEEYLDGSPLIRRWI